MLHIILVFFYINAVSVNGKSHNPCPYERILQSTRDLVIPPGVPAVTRDDNFTVAQTWACGRLYGSEFPAAILAKTHDWFLQQFGIDTNLGQHLGGAAFNLPQGLMFPFTYGTDFLYRVNSDKVNCKETKRNNNWILFNTGYILAHLADGTYPGGVMGGTTYKAGQLISYTEYNLLNEDKQHKWGTINPKWREVFDFASEQPGHTVINSLGLRDEHVYAKLIGPYNKIGFVSFNVAYTNTSRTGTPEGPLIQSTRNTMTWPRPLKYPNPMPSLTPCPVP